MLWDANRSIIERLQTNKGLDFQAVKLCEISLSEIGIGSHYLGKKIGIHAADLAQ